MCNNTDFTIAGGSGGTGGSRPGGGGGGGGAILLIAKNISITGDIDLSGGERGYHRSSGGCCSSWNGGEYGGNGGAGSLWLSATGVTVTGTISAGATRIDAQSIQGNLETTCVFEDLSPSYTNGFANTLEANFSNGELEVRNNGTDTLNVTMSVME